MPDLTGGSRYQISTAFEDLEYGEGLEWRFADYSDPSYSWAEACAIVLEQAARVCHEGAVLTVAGVVKPCELGCLAEDGTPLPGPDCGEPGETRFSVEVRDDTTRHRWFVS